MEDASEKVIQEVTFLQIAGECYLEDWHMGHKVEPWGRLWWWETLLKWDHFGCHDERSVGVSMLRYCHIRCTGPKWGH